MALLSSTQHIARLFHRRELMIAFYWIRNNLYTHRPCLTRHIAYVGINDRKVKTRYGTFQKTLRYPLISMSSLKTTGSEA